MGKRMDGDRIAKEAETVFNTWPQGKRESLLLLIDLMSSNAKKNTGHGLLIEECLTVIIMFFRYMLSDSLTVGQCLDLAVEKWAEEAKAETEAKGHLVDVEPIRHPTLPKVDIFGKEG